MRGMTKGQTNKLVGGRERARERELGTWGSLEDNRKEEENTGEGRMDNVGHTGVQRCNQSLKSVVNPPGLLAQSIHHMTPLYTPQYTHSTLRQPHTHQQTSSSLAQTSGTVILSTDGLDTGHIATGGGGKALSKLIEHNRVGKCG